MYEAMLRVGDASQLIPTAGRDVRVDLWCNDHSDLVQAIGEDSAAVLADVAESVGIADSLVDGDERVAVTEGCLAARRDDNIEAYVGRHGCLLLPPLRYVGGERVCRVLSLSGDALSAVYRDLLADDHSVTVDSKRRIDAVATGGPTLDPAGIVPDLTVRQREALLAAVEGGYYRIPREITTAEIGAALGVERRTAEDHLRRAERKVIETIAEYV
ncbi:helix-turn-helix domain-containing protein [Halorubrum vacuolatum]|uniref:Uncharacterized protein n=1 Tax=Halorubrum vacuolatum TaxID=63740 RepID=A0A238VSI6_HALVU|nr:helix-turn-helix domain-containing protein [Halorubrum vacuolatum]SNR37196.1 hypothetical protein SAMN06264855_10411 [Halorubrum vacuolatum]